MDARQELGRTLSKNKGIRHIMGAKWFVPSLHEKSGYIVDVIACTCTCPDHETRSAKCKHLWAVELLSSASIDGPEVTMSEPVKPKKKTYKQKWPAYNAAQSAEKATVQVLLRALCDGIETPPHPGRGPKPIPLSDVVFGMAMKVYTTFSGRRATSDIQACALQGHMSTTPSYNALFNYFEKPEMTALLASLVKYSALPLKDIERDFAVDSTGFATNTYDRWFDKQYGRNMKKAKWVKAHAMVGVLTNVITSIIVTEENGADSSQFAGLVVATAANFTMEQVSADKAYLSHDNLSIVEHFDAVPYIPLKSNSRDSDRSYAWKRLRAMFIHRQDEFLANYHKRSNVESTFAALKRKLGHSVRSKTFVAQRNEVLLKALCFNLTCLVHAMHELGVDPEFLPVKVTA